MQLNTELLSLLYSVHSENQKNLSITPPRLTGIYNINENRSAVSCFIPTATAEIIVAPERLIPGVNATACPNPTMNASLIVISLFVFSSFHIAN